MTKMIPLPYMLDFYPLQDKKYTEIHRFFENLKDGRFTTTKCKKCGSLLWQPRVVCPHCNSSELEWVDLPKTGEIYAYTSMILGAPLGMEEDVPFVMALVKLDGIDLRILSRIDDIPYEECELGMKLELKIIELEDGRVWYRFKPIT